MAEIPLWDVERIILIGQVYLSAFSSARGCHLWPLADELGVGGCLYCLVAKKWPS